MPQHDGDRSNNSENGRGNDIRRTNKREEILRSMMVADTVDASSTSKAKKNKQRRRHQYFFFFVVFLAFCCLCFLQSLFFIESMTETDRTVDNNEQQDQPATSFQTTAMNNNTKTVLIAKNSTTFNGAVGDSDTDDDDDGGGSNKPTFLRTPWSCNKTNSNNNNINDDDDGVTFQVHPMCNLRTEMGRGGNLSPLLKHRLRRDFVKKSNNKKNNKNINNNDDNTTIMTTTNQTNFLLVCHRDKIKLANELHYNLPIRSSQNPYIVSVHALKLDRCSQYLNDKNKNNNNNNDNNHTTTIIHNKKEADSKHMTLLCEAWYGLWNANRTDILYFALDLADHRLCDNSGLSALPGVTMAPPTSLYRRGTTDKPLEVRDKKYLVTFCGTNHEGLYASSMVRPWLFRSYRQYHNSSTFNNSNNNNMTATKNDNNNNNNINNNNNNSGNNYKQKQVLLLDTPLDNGQEYQELLRQSIFGFVPRGDGRWNFRLWDLIEFGVIPIFLADGYSPPFDDYLIDWKLASIQWPEIRANHQYAAANNTHNDGDDDNHNKNKNNNNHGLESMVQELRNLPIHKVQQMANRIEEIRTYCFASASVRAECLLQSLSVLANTTTKSSSSAEIPSLPSTHTSVIAERLRIPLCPRQKMEVHSGDVVYENNTFETFDVLY